MDMTTNKRETKMVKIDYILKLNNWFISNMNNINNTLCWSLIFLINKLDCRLYLNHLSVKKIIQPYQLRRQPHQVLKAWGLNKEISLKMHILQNWYFNNCRNNEYIFCNCNDGALKLIKYYLSSWQITSDAIGNNKNNKTIDSIGKGKKSINRVLFSNFSL